MIWLAEKQNILYGLKNYHDLLNIMDYRDLFVYIGILRHFNSVGHVLAVSDASTCMCFLAFSHQY